MVREACGTDLDAIAELCRQLGYDLPRDQLETNLSAVLADPNQEILVCEGGSRVLGMISLQEQVSITEPRFGLITAVVVDEAFRGRGVGKELLNAAQDWCRDRGLRRMRLRANIVREEAHQFYERFGFVAKKDQRVFELLLDC